MSRPSPHGPQEHSCCHAPQIHGWASRVRPRGRGPSTSCEIPQPLQTPAGQREIQVLPLLAFPNTGTGTDTAPCIPAEEHRYPGRDLITTTCPGSATGLPGSHHRPSSGDFSPGQKSPKHKAKLLHHPTSASVGTNPAAGSTAARHGAGAEPWGAAPLDATEPKVGLCSSPRPSGADAKRSPDLIWRLRVLAYTELPLNRNRAGGTQHPQTPTFQGIQLSKHFPAPPSLSTAAGYRKRPQSTQCLQPARKGVPKTEHCTGAITLQGKHHPGQ